MEFLIKTNFEQIGIIKLNFEKHHLGIMKFEKQLETFFKSVIIDFLTDKEIHFPTLVNQFKQAGFHEKISIDVNWSGFLSANFEVSIFGDDDLIQFDVIELSNIKRFEV
tara:strand:+ start:437 stop:763 length:327 start_codon:yes stop_codon:yes gene_type:complete